MSFYRLLFILGFTFAVPVAKAETILVESGKPTVEIVLDKQPARAAQFAAAELQYHIQKITGAKLPIVREPSGNSDLKIYVGESRFTRENGLKSSDFAVQEYAISFLPNAIILIGHDREDRGIMNYADEKTFPDTSTRDKYGQGGTGGFYEQGTCYAVYDFLENYCGVRWFLPTELGLDFISRKTLSVPEKNVRRQSFYHHRILVKELGISNDLCGDTIDTGNPVEILNRREAVLWSRRSRLGGIPFACNHSLYGYYNRFLKTHPEWFAKGYSGRPPQLCYTSPGLIQQVAQDARNFFDSTKDKPQKVYSTLAAGDFFAVMPMDNLQHCKCDQCQKLIKNDNYKGSGVFTDRLSRYYYSFVNAVAREVAKTHPGKYITTAAYNYSAFPPDDQKMEPNVAIVLCLGIRQPYNLERRKNDIQMLKEWHEAAPDNPKSVWLYFCYPVLDAKDGKYRCFPGFFSLDLIKMMQDFRNCGIRGFFIEPSYMNGSIRNALMDQLELYLIAKLSEDPSLDGVKLRKEFFQRYYGAAAVPMEQIYTEMEKAYCDSSVKYPDEGVQTQAVAWGVLGTAERMERWQNLFQEALKLAANEKEKQRLALFEKGILQYMKSGREAYLQTLPVREATAGKKIHVPLITGHGWEKAAVFDGFYTLDGKLPKCTISGKMKHDGKNLYVMMTVSGQKSSFPEVKARNYYNDGWWIYFAKQRSYPYHQLLVEPDGSFTARAHYETAGVWNSGVKIQARNETASRFIELAFPLADLLPNGVKPGEKIYFNVTRANPDKENSAWIPTFTGGRDAPSRFGELILEK